MKLLELKYIYPRLEWTEERMKRGITLTRARGNTSSPALNLSFQMFESPEEQADWVKRNMVKASSNHIIQAKQLYIYGPHINCAGKISDLISIKYEEVEHRMFSLFPGERLYVYEKQNFTVLKLDPNLELYLIQRINPALFSLQYS